ncbi:TonB-dependent receptor [Rufibacter sp. DG15C]|uniref:SusC/RagA family TonB-linked outer membrane protein n=1 Tax=Rufibacter sp. DG15C TaxID=1379909 RepID=UPI00078EE6B7|nr:TonB-dependent receptor [Rufibacter sp. DG15C]AMM51303.1 TonB-dependent receptor [Rufibacter sp. DG15C]
MKKTLLLSFVFVLALITQAWAQNRTVTGRVTDAQTGDGMPGVTVQLKGTTNASPTDGDGRYEISVPSTGGTLVFTFIGYSNQEVNIGTRSTVDVRLAADQQALNEIVVVGYGTQLKKDVTSSISQVKGEAIANLATPSFDQQLSGRAAGVVVQQPSGILGAPPTIRIRGVNSISGSNSPLIVIDGVPASSGNVGAFTSVNALADINPNDIESFEILKDGAATAIYGSRASNGVILITTKQGKQGQLKFNYDGWTGWSEATELHDLLNAEQFVEIQNEKYRNAGSAEPAKFDGTNTNWNDYVYRRAFQQSHTISASAGTERTKYYVSLGYSDQEGIAVANSLNRYSLRANLNQKVSNKIIWDVQTGLTHQENLGPLIGTNSLSGNTFAVIRMLPNVPVYNPNDPTGYNVDATTRSSLGRGPNTITIANGIPNQMFVLENNTRAGKTYRFVGNTSLSANIIDKLTFKTLIGADFSIVDDFSFQDPRHGDGLSSGGSLTQAYSPFYTWNWQNILSYNTSFNEAHNVDATLVAEYTKSRSSFFQASGTTISDRFFNENIQTGTLTTQQIFGDLEENGLASYLGRVNYNFKSKYYLGVSLRADGLSKLSPDNRWGYFPGVSAAYRISEEDFFKNSGVVDIISDLRIRGSYAEVGNSGIVSGNYGYLGSFGSVQYGGESGIAFSNTGNPNLKWETQKISDVGLDLGFFNGRLNFEFAYWKKDNDDIVLGAPTPPSLGVPGNLIYRNIGRMVNDGLEFSVNGNVIETSAFTWNSSVNFSTQRNEVKELVEGQDIIGAYNIIRVGESFNSIYGYMYEGVNMSNGNPIYKKANGSLVQGDINGNAYKVYDPANPTDVSKAASLSASDKVVLGGALPTWFGGFDNNFKYAGFDMNVFFRFSGGNKIMNRTRQDLLTMLFENNGTEILGRWQSVDKPGDGQTPKLRQGRQLIINTENEASSRFVESGDFLKLSNVSLGYTIPKTFTEKYKIERVRIFAQLQNAVTISGYKGLDPEMSSSIGVDYNTNPQQRVLSFGVNLGF